MAQFMAVEVEARRYLFKGDRKWKVSYRAAPFEDEAETSLLLHTPSMPSPFAPQVLFRYGILHDRESIWWIALWCLFMHCPVDDKSDPDSQSQTASLVFPGYHFPTDHRYIIFTVATMWQHDIATLPAEFAPAAHHRELLNSALQSTYCATYENFMDEDTGLISSIAKLASDDPSVSWVTVHQAF
jgi:hypothetical protein